MMHDPYASDGQTAIYAEPQRTSVMAILSLVCSLICCIPGLGLLGALLGIASLITIGGSGGRVGGRGLAIAGVIIGILCTVVWVGMYYGAEQIRHAWIGLAEPVMTDVESGQFDAVRAAFDPSVAPTDEELTAFRAAYQSELGSFQRGPKGWGEIFSVFTNPQIGPQMQSYQGRQDILPLPASFDQGWSLVIFEFDPQAQPGGGKPMFEDMAVLRPDGTEIRLSEILQPAP
ncbi:MAG: hypothetical protein R3B57_12885 [Phycisphaerales bacterium]